MRRDTEDVSRSDNLVLKFVEARGTDNLLRFLSDYGIVTGWPDDNAGVNEEAFERILELQQGLEWMLLSANGADYLSEVSARVTLSIRLRPGGRPTLLLRPQSLLGFMRVEAALLLCGDTGIARCRYCGTPFLTGPASGKRSHAQYCADECRYKYNRKRVARHFSK